MKKTLLLFILFVDCLLSEAPVISQEISLSNGYPTDYFRNPLAIPMQLAANFGELRSNHFHMGFDIRTNQRENLPVYAAAEGYVSRIKIERYGFGKAIYITHPNGYTTLYAHLKEFYPALQSYVKNREYEEQSWEQDMTFEPEEFPVEKGTFIAYSGNTGGSQGPHLHFEIRDTKTGNNLNPWLFGLGLPDKKPPFIYRLYYYDRRYSTYQASALPISIKGLNGQYSTRDAVVILSSPFISFGISAEDKTNVPPFRFGIYQASVSIDDSLSAEFTLNNISYDDTRYINGSIDYKTRMAGGAYIQHLSRLPGNNSTIFSTAGDGTILIPDTLIHSAEILVGDASGNSSVLNFRFRWDPKRTKEITATDTNIRMIPAKKNVYKSDDLEADFSEKAFYDTVRFVHRSVVSKEARLVSAVHYISNYTIPVHDSFTVSIKPNMPVSDSLKDRVIMQLVSNHKTEAMKGGWSGDFMKAKVRDFGIVKLLLDTIAPRVSLSGWINGGSVRNRKSISILVTDNAGEIKECNIYIDNKWMLFGRKDDFFTHIFDERTTAGVHKLNVVAEDMAGNITEKTYRFTR